MGCSYCGVETVSTSQGTDDGGKKKFIVLGVTSSRLYHHPKLNLTPAADGVTFEAIVFPALLSMTCPRGCYYVIIQGSSFFFCIYNDVAESQNTNKTGMFPNAESLVHVLNIVYHIKKG